MGVAAGGRISFRSINGVIGGVIKYDGKNCVLTAFHILKTAGLTQNDSVNVEGFKAVICELLPDQDLAVFELLAPDSVMSFSNIGKPEIGPAETLKGNMKRPCNIMTVGRAFHYLSFAPRSIPLPGESGSPIIQNGKIVGILSALNYNNATGMAASVEMFRNCKNKD